MKRGLRSRKINPNRLYRLAPRPFGLSPQDEAWPSAWVGPPPAAGALSPRFLCSSYRAGRSLTPGGAAKPCRTCTTPATPITPNALASKTAFSLQKAGCATPRSRFSHLTEAVLAPGVAFSPLPNPAAYQSCMSACLLLRLHPPLETTLCLSTPTLASSLPLFICVLFCYESLQIRRRNFDNQANLCYNIPAPRGDRIVGLVRPPAKRLQGL